MILGNFEAQFFPAAVFATRANFLLCSHAGAETSVMFVDWLLTARRDAGMNAPKAQSIFKVVTMNVRRTPSGTIITPLAVRFQFLAPQTGPFVRFEYEVVAIKCAERRWVARSAPFGAHLNTGLAFTAVWCE